MEASACIGVKLNFGVLPVTSQRTETGGGIEVCVPYGMTALGWVQSVNATRLVVYRRVFQSPRSFVGVD